MLPAMDYIVLVESKPDAPRREAHPKTKEPLNKSSAAEQRIFSPSCAVSKVGKT